MVPPPPSPGQQSVVDATKRQLAADPGALKQLLQSLNVPQSLEANLRNLRELGGVRALASKLGVRVDAGVDSATLSLRRELLGTNALPQSPRKSFWALFVDTFDDGTLQILVAAALVSLAIGIYDDPATGYVEGSAILCAVLIVSGVTAVNDYQKESQFRELSDSANSNTDVVVQRDRSHHQVPLCEVAVGDLVHVQAGDAIPCDGVLVAANQLQVDESALTGEPLDIDKDMEDDPFLLSGCTVEAGTGVLLAIAVGKDSQWGVIQSHLEKEQDQTPLQEKLDDMAAMIGYIGMAAAAATFSAMMSIKVFVQPEHLQQYSIFEYALEAFIIGVTIVVVAVPEGLPLAVTISLAFSTKKMLADQNLIRHLQACETMGNATNICSDKTGTLTENRMTVVRGIFADMHIDDTIHRVPVLLSKPALEVILECIACCSTARVVEPTIDDAASTDGMSVLDHSETSNAAPVPDLRPTVIGNKTEGALLLLARSSWTPHDDPDVRRNRARFDQPDGSRMFPFSSQRKCMTVLVRKSSDIDHADHNNNNNNDTTTSATTPSRRTLRSAKKNQSWTLYHKGAAEQVIERCRFYLDIHGNQQIMTKEKRKEFQNIVQDFASDALRCVALAHKIVTDADCPKNTTLQTIAPNQVEAHLEKDLCLDAITGIMDPLRPDVVDAVAVCQRAGIVVRMVTGDNLDTAQAIAKQAGILKPGGVSMVGEQFRKLTPKELDEVLPNLQVLARSSPEDKHLLVQRLNGALMPSTQKEWEELHPGRSFEKERNLLLPGYKDEWSVTRHGVGEVVGVTGDGTNDGPALRAADVGLSMGLSGTDVAKKASDIIILDDKFSSIVKAVLWGRSVFDNIRKFLQFQLTVNVVALTITFLAAVVGYQPPLNAVMMLWVNLIMDTMGALALGTEPPLAELLDRRPYRRDASLISRPMWRNILCQAVYQLLLLVFLLNRGPQMFDCEDGSRHHFTILFNAFVFCQVFNEFNAREIGDRFDPVRRLAQSPMFIMVIVFTVISQWAIVEFGGDFTQTYPLSWEEWKMTVGLGAVSIPIGFFMRLIPVSEDPSTFAGIERKPKEVWLLTPLLLVLAPIFIAIVYQLVYEIDEFSHPQATAE